MKPQLFGLARYKKEKLNPQEFNEILKWARTLRSLNRNPKSMSEFQQFQVLSPETQAIIDKLIGHVAATI